jgi:hypothetical protein
LSDAERGDALEEKRCVESILLLHADAARFDASHGRVDAKESPAPLPFEKDR